MATSKKTEKLHTVPKDLQAILKSDDTLAKIWKNLTPLARNEWVCYVTIVKKEQTRKEHLVRLVEDLGKGKKRPCCWPGCPHRRPSAQKWFVKQ